jgi:hypothetical protein
VSDNTTGPIDDVDIKSGYLGNPLLKRVNEQIDWTPERVKEYLKCAEDPIYFTENYVKIINVDEGLVNFKLYDYQREIMLSYKDNRNTIVCTARQVGKCCSINTPIRLRNKRTGQVLETTIGNFFENERTGQLPLL